MGVGLWCRLWAEAGCRRRWGVQGLGGNLGIKRCEKEGDVWDGAWVEDGVRVQVLGRGGVGAGRVEGEDSATLPWDTPLCNRVRGFR